MFFNFGKIELTRIWGVPLRLDLSLLILVLLFAFRIGFLPGLVFAALLMASVLLHELGHVAVALSFKCRVRDITLSFVGGCAAISDIPRTPWKEALMALAGPLVSLALSGLAWLAIPHSPSPLVYVVSLYVFRANLMLCLFNLIPAFPMDGGRIFRALLSGTIGRRKATFVAYRVAQATAVLMAIYAITHGVDFLLLFIAYMIYVAAREEYNAVLMEGFYGDGMSDDTVVISPPPYRSGSDRANLKRN